MKIDYHKTRPAIFTCLLLILFSAIQGIPNIKAAHQHQPRAIKASTKQNINVNPESQAPAEIKNTNNSLAELTNSPASEFKRITLQMSESSEAVDLIKHKLKLEELIKNNPELLHGISQILSDPDFSPRAKLALIHSLQQISSDESKALLTEIIRSEQYGHAEKMQAIVSTGDLTEPSADNLNALWDTYSAKETPADMKSSALLNLGVSAANSYEKSKTSSEQTVGKLITELSTATSDSEKQTIIDALGNSESARTLGAVNPYLESEDAGVRASANYALRYTNSPQADDRLFNSIENDPSAEVRIAAVSALNLKNAPPGKISKISNLLFTEPDSSVRLALIRLIGLKVKESKVGSDALKAQLKMENDSSNYENIIEILHTNY